MVKGKPPDRHRQGRHSLFMRLCSFEGLGAMNPTPVFPEEKQMEKMWTLFKNFVKEDDGMETVEYAVVAALVILAGVAIWSTLGGTISSKIDSLNSAVST
jgi:Flp pilus assembly pilin Flp